MPAATIARLVVAAMQPRRAVVREWAETVVDGKRGPPAEKRSAVLRVDEARVLGERGLDVVRPDEERRERMRERAGLASRPEHEARAEEGVAQGLQRNRRIQRYAIGRLPQAIGAIIAPGDRGFEIAAERKRMRPRRRRPFARGQRLEGVEVR